MKRYLLDTNVFFEMLCSMKGVMIPTETFVMEKEAEYYVSEVTKVEIYSVIGKYARGEQKQWQICNRQIDENGTMCVKKYYNPGRKRWNGKKIRDLKKLVSDILGGHSEMFKVQVLPVTQEVLCEAERFVQYAFKYKFASLDAVIAATAKCYADKDLIVVTHDKSLRSALSEDGVHVQQKRNGS